ncbi:Nudix hydrolase [Seminavis robusta]|uniref:Nudix hydrolase n=1 Tax=Seminavis robusta TaxID=568900 RepID=A0A9N8HQB6_9STRA|nr:Nudix hydrolase [Seminavis robusta]|eukprot:Sro1423_g271400.1 Nudix hydrolase (392) ;mRNA; r:22682-23857
MADSTPTTTTVYAPSRFVIDESTQKKYRMTAAAAVFNSQNQLLVGERVSIANAWQAPQGGVDAAWEENQFQEETVTQAATRELYEEMGLVLGKHVVLMDATTTNDDAGGIRYETDGTNSWLAQSGFAGQELHWVLFRCIDGRGDADPSGMCDLSGQNGESAEFRQAEWRSLTDVIDNIWPAKRGPYEALQNMLSLPLSTWQQSCQETAQTFQGTWTRKVELSRNLEAALNARGLTKDQIETSLEAPYKQTWTFDNGKSSDQQLPEWKVTTYGNDGVTPRRVLVYPVGKEWEEEYDLTSSALFGKTANDNDAGGTATLQRRTFYAPQSLEGKGATVAHVTITQTPNGDIEESRRYRDGEHFCLLRTFWAKDGTVDGVVSMELFCRDKDESRA